MRRLAATVLLGVATAAPAGADPITDRQFTLDLHRSAAIGSPRIIATGGAGIASAEGSAFISLQPAAVAVRPATSQGTWDWDWHADWIIPDPGTDLDNDGVTAASGVGDTIQLTFGALVYLGSWGLGVDLSFVTARVELESGDPFAADATATVAKVALGRAFAGDQLAVGLALRAGEFSVAAIPTPGAPSETAFSLGGNTAEAGAVWRPQGGNVRVGATAALPVRGDDLDTVTCDPADCFGFILPTRVEVPWQVGVGAAWHRGPTPWNRHVDDDFRDERATTVALDLLLVGAVDDGQAVNAFLRQERVRSGGSPVLSPRAGVEHEWLPGRLRVRAGTYWEPGRIDDRDGRLHVTLGAELRVLAFCFLGDRYRARIALATDGARDFANGGLSIGLWH